MAGTVRGGQGLEQTRARVQLQHPLALTVRLTVPRLSWKKVMLK